MLHRSVLCVVVTVIHISKPGHNNQNIKTVNFILCSLWTYRLSTSLMVANKLASPLYYRLEQAAVVVQCFILLMRFFAT